MEKLKELKENDKQEMITNIIYKIMLDILLSLLIFEKHHIVNPIVETSMKIARRRSITNKGEIDRTCNI